MPSLKPLRIAVTGVAGASGQSLIKALDQSHFNLRIFPVDVQPYSAGLYFGYGGTLLPKPEEDIQPWIDFVKFHHIDAIIPGADRDLLPLANHAAETKAIVAPRAFVEMARDKFVTARTLSEIGVTTPMTFVPGAATLDLPSLRFPCVVKPRNDAAMRGFHICNDLEELNFYLRRIHDPMIQEYLPGDEYSCNLFCDREGQAVASIIMRREMRDGVAIRSQAVLDQDVLDYGLKVVQALKPTGVVNIQIKRDRNAQPKCMEINARCSGSTAIRASLGYNEAEMLVRHFVMGETIRPPEIDYGKFCLRYYQELYVDLQEIERKKVQFVTEQSHV